MLFALASANIIWASTVPVGLNTLIPGGSLTAGNGVIFDNFSFSRTCSGAGSCSPADASGVNVNINAFDDLRFTGGFAALAAPGPITADFLISFDVTAPADLDLVGLGFNGAASGAAFAQIVEQIFASGGALLAQIVVDTSGSLSGNAAFTATHKIRIDKDIQLTAAENGHATISLIEQGFRLAASTEGGEVPEPTSALLMGLGLIGLRYMRR